MATSRYSNALAYRPYGPTPGVYGSNGPSNALAALVNGYNPRAVTQAVPSYVAPAAVMPTQQAPAAQPAAAPPMPAQPQTPVSVGSVPWSSNPDGGQAGSDAVGAANDPGMQATPADWGDLAGSYGGIAGQLGGLFGGPIGGLVGTGLGTTVDVAMANSALAGYGVPQDMSFPSALASNLTGGLFGTSPTDQFNSIVGTNMTENPDLEGLAAQLAATQAPADVGGGAVADPMGAANQALGGFDNVSGAIGGLFGGGFDAGFGGFSGGDGGYGGNDPQGNADSSAGGFGPDGDGSGGMGAGGGEWWTGGYTGLGTDNLLDPFAPAGTVHEGEVVIPANMVQRYGRNALMGYVNGTAPSRSEPTRSAPRSTPSSTSRSTPGQQHSTRAEAKGGGDWVDGGDLKRAFGKSLRGNGA